MKAAGRQFAAFDQDTSLRNAGIADSKPADHLWSAHTHGVRPAAAFDSGRFARVPVPLRVVLTDGRLPVLGGVGGSAAGAPNPGHFANDDDWYDDVSDGPVTTTVTPNDGTVVPVFGNCVAGARPSVRPWRAGA